MVDWGDELKKKLGESRPPEMPQKPDLNAISSSLNETSQSLDEKQKQLQELTEQRNKILEKINQKIRLIKADSEKAESLMAQGNYSEASESWKKVIELDPENVLAKNNLSICSEKIDALKNPVIPVAADELKTDTPPDNASVGENPKPSGDAIMTNAELDMMLQGITGSQAQAIPENRVGVPEASDSVLSQSQLNELLNQPSEISEKKIPEPENSSVQTDASEIMSQSELDQLIGKMNATQAMPEQKAEDAILGDLEVHDSDIAKLTDEFKTIGDVNSVKDIVKEDQTPEKIEDIASVNSGDSHVVTLETEEPLQVPEQVLREEDMETVLKELAKPGAEDMSDVERMGDTIAAQATGDMLEAVSPKSGQADVKKEEDIASTKVVTHVAVVREKDYFLRKNVFVPLLVSVIIVLFMAAVTGMGVFYYKYENVRNSRVESTGAEQKVETKLKEGKILIDAGKATDGANILLSISEDLPSISVMMDHFFKAADMMYEYISKKEQPSRDEYINTAKLYEMIIGGFPGNARTDAAYFRAAECYYNMGVYNKSFEYIESIVKNYTDSQYYETALLKYARLLVLMNRYKEARTAFLKIIHEYPNSHSAKMSQIDIARTYQLEAFKIRERFNIKEPSIPQTE